MFIEDLISNELNKVPATPIMEAILNLHHHLLIGLLVILGLVITYILLYIYNKRIWIINSIVSLFMVLGIMFNDVGVVYAMHPGDDTSDIYPEEYYDLCAEMVGKIKSLSEFTLQSLNRFNEGLFKHAVVKGKIKISSTLGTQSYTRDEALGKLYSILCSSRETCTIFLSRIKSVFPDFSISVPDAVPTKVAEKIVDVVASSSSAAADTVAEKIVDVVASSSSAAADTVAEKVVDAVASSSLAVPEDDSYPKYIKYGLIVSSMLFGGYMIYKGMEISGLLDNLFGSKIPDGEIIKDSVEKATTKEKVVGAGMILLGLTCIVAGVIFIFGGK